MLVSHIRSHLQFYLLFVSVFNALAYMHYSIIMPFLVVFTLWFVQLYVVFKSVVHSIVKQWGAFGFGLAVVHVIVFVVYFDRLLSTIK